MAARRGARLRAGRYELERLLGRGGAASVWLARDTLLERPVAVKLLSEALAADQDWMARFRREARIAARLQHPNLVSIYDFEAEAEQPYLVMAYMPGGSLAERIESGDGLDPERLAGDLLRALEHIHAAGIIHRDVKPANVLLDRDDRACLTDFGIARPEDATSITQTGQIPGTARYMAPELWRGEPASERSDLFACGTVLSRCLGDEAAPAGLIGLVERLTAEDPALRPRSALEARQSLEADAPLSTERTPTTATAPLGVAAGGGEAMAARPPLEPGSGPSTTSRRWPAVAGLAALAVLAAVAIAGALGGSDGEPGERSPTAERSEGGSGERTRDGRPEDAESGGASTPAVAEPAEPSGIVLNDQGYALIQEGRYEEAIPILEQAVASLEGSGDITYAFALYNLGNALRLAGRPAEAIPILEARLEIPNQTEVVREELKRAEEDLREQDKAAREAEKERKKEEKGDD